MVAKAIVRAVNEQNPPGRFLELVDKNRGIWKEVHYKKAVDKSSQALREKWDKSDEDETIQKAMTAVFNNQIESAF